MSVFLNEKRKRKQNKAKQTLHVFFSLIDFCFFDLERKLIKISFIQI